MSGQGAGWPDHGSRVARAGVDLALASSAMLLLHGRGATAESILTLADLLPVPGMAYLAPQAAENTWYPQRFIVPLEQNEPWLSAALACVGRVLARIERGGVPPERTVLLGFSQGGCLALEYAVRTPRRYGAVIGLSAGLIGPPGTTWSTAGDLAGTPVFLGCSDVDGHIPAARVHESGEVFRALGAEVTEVLYPGMDHTVSEDELLVVRRLLEPLGTASRGEVGR